jgi:hypothetical protein
MKNKNKMIFGIGIFLTGFANANAPSGLSTEAARLQADLYAISLETTSDLNTLELPQPGDSLCLPRPSLSCIQYVAGTYPNTKEKIEAARACAGNYGSDCAQYVAGFNAGAGDRQSAAIACNGVLALGCVQYVAGSFPNMSEKVAAAKACVNVVDINCVNYVAGSFPSVADRIAAARACGGF